MATVFPDTSPPHEWICCHAVSQTVIAAYQNPIDLESIIIRNITDELSKHNLNFSDGTLSWRDDHYTNMRTYAWRQNSKTTKTTMNDKIYVIALTYDEFMKYIRDDCDRRVRSGQTTVSLSEYVFVDSQYKLLGVREAHGVFVGSYKKRPDLYDLVTAISLSYAPDMDPISKYNEICQRIGLTA